MANPQQENGHVRIANEIMDELSTLTLSSREWNVVMFVLRKTWGWAKKWDNIALSQFRKGCRLNQSQVCKILKTLVSRKILLKGVSGYCFNKDYEKWVVSPLTPPSITADNRVVSPVTHTKATITIEPIITKNVRDASRTLPKKRKPVAKIFSDDSKEIELSRLLYQEIFARNKKAKSPNFQSWAGEFDKMLRIDRHTVEEIEAVIVWCQSNNFWRRNILSAATLREKFPRLWGEGLADLEKIIEQKKQQAIRQEEF